MAHSLKQIKNRIRSIENTEKVTAAMEMVSVAKLSRVDKFFLALKPYFADTELLLNNFIRPQDALINPLLEERKDNDKICLCIITSDSGLCGLYNSNIIRFSEQLIHSRGKGKVKLVVIGSKGFRYFRKQQVEILNSYLRLNGRYSDKINEEIVDFLTKVFLSKDVGKVLVAYTHYQTTLLQRPIVENFLNIEAEDGKKTDYILEPDRKGILDELVPKYIALKMKKILLESFTSEHTARTIAMKTATDNAKELLEGLVLLKNKVRQANITEDIMEIISSSEALKG